jgi:hypothetical protein
MAAGVIAAIVDQVTGPVHFILYVKDQVAAAASMPRR